MIIKERREGITGEGLYKRFSAEFSTSSIKVVVQFIGFVRQVIPNIGKDYIKI
jgi:hypothetical protein